MNELQPPVDPARDHVEGGAADGPTLVLFGDYECPYTGSAWRVVEALLRREGDRLRFAFRHFPLTTKHPHALGAAEAAEAAAAQGRFREMHRALFADRRALGAADLRAHAAAAGLDLERFDGDLAAHTGLARVEEDMASGERSGVRGTPTFFVEGRRYEGFYDVETLSDELALARAPRRAPS